MAATSPCIETTQRLWPVMYVFQTAGCGGVGPGFRCGVPAYVVTCHVRARRVCVPQFYHTESVVKMTGPEGAQVACVYVSHKMFKTVVRALLVDQNCSVEVRVRVCQPGGVGTQKPLLTTLRCANCNGGTGVEWQW